MSFYRTTQQPVVSPFSNVRRAALVAASNTSSTPSPLKLEHSRYRLAPISRATPSPSWAVTNRWDFLRISSMATGSSRRSFFSPTRMMGTPSQRRVASSIHYSSNVSAKRKSYPNDTQYRRTLCLTLSRESGVSTEKPIRITCALE